MDSALAVRSVVAESVITESSVAGAGSVHCNFVGVAESFVSPTSILLVWRMRRYRCLLRRLVHF